MKVEINKELKIKLKDNDISNFKSVLEKIIDKGKIIGFKKVDLNEEEFKIIQTLLDKINN